MKSLGLILPIELEELLDDELLVPLVPVVASYA
jgi:hypothetical protein